MLLVHPSTRAVRPPVSASSPEITADDLFIIPEPPMMSMAVGSRTTLPPRITSGKWSVHVAEPMAATRLVDITNARTSSSQMLAQEKPPQEKPPPNDVGEIAEDGVGVKVGGEVEVGRTLVTAVDLPPEAQGVAAANANDGQEEDVPRHTINACAARTWGFANSAVPAAKRGVEATAAAAAPPISGVPR